MEAVFVRLAEKVPISSAWIAEQLPDIELGADVEQAWEEWVMARGRTVHEPGIPTPRARKELEAALLLYPGEFGIPLAYPVPPGSGFRWLINQRKEAWVSSFAATKSASLAVVAVGRGPEIQAVAQAHLDFLDALAKGQSKRRLKEKLKAAEDVLGRLTTPGLQGNDQKP